MHRFVVYIAEWADGSANLIWNLFGNYFGIVGLSITLQIINFKVFRMSVPYNWFRETHFP